jgi:hypothetical protein
MSDEIDPLSFADAVLEQETRDAEMRKSDPGSKVTYFPAWGHHKDGKIIRPLLWRKPGVDEWERQSIEFHAKQAEEAKQFADANEERVRRERLADRSEIEFGASTDAGTPASKKKSRSKPIELVIG